MARLSVFSERGLLRAEKARQNILLNRYEPVPALQPFIDRYWVVSWNLNEPYEQEVLPYPCINVSAENWADSARNGFFVTGVMTGKSRHLLTESGYVVAAMFKPGGFYPFLGRSLSQLCNITLSLNEVFPRSDAELKKIFDQSVSELDRVNILEAFFTKQVRTDKNKLALISNIYQEIQGDSSIVQVHQLAERFSIPERTLSRIFREQVGVSAKWVIRLFRLQEAILRIENAEGVDWAGFALELGYADQAHFINDFKSIIGFTPENYRKNI